MAGCVCSCKDKRTDIQAFIVAFAIAEGFMSSSDHESILCQVTHRKGQRRRMWRVKRVKEGSKQGKKRREGLSVQVAGPPACLLCQVVVHRTSLTYSTHSTDRHGKSKVQQDLGFVLCASSVRWGAIVICAIENGHATQTGAE